MNAEHFWPAGAIQLHLNERMGSGYGGCQELPDGHVRPVENFLGDVNDYLVQGETLRHVDRDRPCQVEES